MDQTMKTTDDVSTDVAATDSTIGASLKIIGDINGQGNLIINGAVEGTIIMREGSVLVGAKGRVSAHVAAPKIHVEGEVRGELQGSEQVSVSANGKVIGDIRAPRVILDDGCQFKGSVDMEDKVSMSIDDHRASNAKLPKKTLPTRARFSPGSGKTTGNLRKP